MSETHRENTTSSTRSDAPDGETVSVTEAARRLRVSVRTVQRRLDKGELQAVQEGDTRRVLLRDTTRQTGRHATRHNATFDATRDTMSRDSDATPHATEGDRLRDIETILSLEKDARIADLREVVESQKLQIEAANRQAAEATAALREYLKLQAKALPSGDQLAEVGTQKRERAVDAVSSRDVGAQEPQTEAATKVSSSTQKAVKREMRPLWKVILGVR